MTVALLQPGEPFKLMDADAGAAPVNGPTCAMPGTYAKVITWGTSFAAAPASATVKIQISMDGAVWNDLDSSTAVGGETKTTNPTSAAFVRARKDAQTGGGALTVTAQISY